MSRVATAIESVREQWDEAPWFVLLMIAIAAIIGAIATGGTVL